MRNPMPASAHARWRAGGGATTRSVAPQVTRTTDTLLASDRGLVQLKAAAARQQADFWELMVGSDMQARGDSWSMPSPRQFRRVRPKVSLARPWSYRTVNS